MKKTLILSVVAIISFHNSCPGQKAPFANAIRKSTDSIHSFLKRSRCPGISVTVSVNGTVVWSEGFGYADVEQKVPVYPDKTKFRIASISKPITATGLAILYEQGKIQLDSSIYFYVPAFPRKKYRPTIRQLAGHMGGIRWYQGNEFFSATRYTTVSDGLRIFENDSLMFKPGTQYVYTSFGFNLLSAAMEKAAGKDFLSFMKEQVLKPRRMSNTVPDLTDSVIPYRSRFYAIANHQLVNAPFVDNSNKWAGGGFLSTTEDLVKFGYQYLQPGFLKKETVDLFTTSQKLDDGTSNNYGIGWGTGKDEKGRKWFGHRGGAVGGVSELLIYPQERVVIAVLTNLSDAGIDNMPAMIAGLFMR